jgi:hypothetical protein
MLDNSLTVKCDKASLSEAEIDEVNDNPIPEWLQAAIGMNPDGFVDMIATVEASGFAAAVITTLNRVAEMTRWPVRSVEVMATRDFDAKWGLVDVSFS